MRLSRTLEGLGARAGRGMGKWAGVSLGVAGALSGAASAQVVPLQDAASSEVVEKVGGPPRVLEELELLEELMAEAEVEPIPQDPDALQPPRPPRAPRARRGVIGFHEGFPPDALPVDGAPGAFWYPDLPEGYVLIDGDIQVRLEDYLQYLGGNRSVFGDASFWPNNLVPYDFVTSGSGAVSAANQQLAINAMNQIAARTGLTFRPAVSSDSARIRFQASTVNNSPVGRQGGAQIINIASWNTQFVIIHEIYHSLGFWHEQSAYDRNDFVIINWGNIQSGYSHNFDIRGNALVYGPYDFDSFMHYPRWAFSANGQDTITCRPPYAQWQNLIGQRDHFSYWDEISCRGIYRYSNDYWWQTGGSGTGRVYDPIGGTLPSRMATLPAGSNLFIRNAGSYSAIGIYSNPITIIAPRGATLGN
jgi:hypothetical protein